jgi:glycosyltransferase involved in cell wall biosynthesis
VGVQAITKISIITPCKNRLHHLKQTLPLTAGQPDCEVIVVDYDCEHGTGDWVEKEHPEVRVVRVADAPDFHLARARNVGAEAARGSYLCFVDADCLVQGNLSPLVDKPANSGSFYLAGSDTLGLGGFLMCGKDVFEEIGGYDEAFVGWGGEDRDMVRRLEMAGQTAQKLPAELLSIIQHGDEERQLGENHPAGNLIKPQTGLVNYVYQEIKLDLMRIGNSQLPLEQRQKIYQAIVSSYLNALSNGDKAFTVRIGLPLRQSGPAISGTTKELIYHVPAKRWKFRAAD